MKYARHTLTSLALASVLATCGLSAQADTVDLSAASVSTQSSTDGTQGNVIYSATTTLTEGEATPGYQLPQGSFLVLITSTGSGGGAKVSWSVPGCASATETKYLNALCVLPQSGGVLTVSNPAAEWKGDESVTIEIKRLRDTYTTMANGFVVANETQAIIEGGARSFTLPEGNYRAEVGSALSGVKVVWKGLHCSSYAESKSYVGACAIPSTGGTITISNPSAEYKGSEDTTILIKKVASATLATGTVVVDETQTIPETGTRTYTFAPGRYMADISGVTNGLDVRWSKTRCMNSVNAMGGSYHCALPKGGSLILKNSDAPYWMGNETVKVKVTKIQ
jgi:hypothetical protein